MLSLFRCPVRKKEAVFLVIRAAGAVHFPTQNIQSHYKETKATSELFLFIKEADMLSFIGSRGRKCRAFSVILLLTKSKNLNISSGATSQKIKISGISVQNFSKTMIHPNITSRKKTKLLFKSILIDKSFYTANTFVILIP